MKTKLIIYLSISSLAIVMEVFWFAFLVCSISLVDIGFGLYLVWKLKEEQFSLGRLLEGFLKMIAYVAFIGLAYLISDKIFNGKQFEIEHLIPKIVTVFFFWLEGESIDRKRVRLGRTPISQEIRAKIKFIKEIRKSVLGFNKE